MDEERLVTDVDTVNGRRIMKVLLPEGPVWNVPIRGPHWRQGEPLIVFRKCPSLESARELAQKLGPISASDVPEIED
jgi:hypothetical protein